MHILLIFSITTPKWKNCIKRLKRNITAGIDCTENEYLPNLKVYWVICFLNLVLSSGVIPEAWLEGISNPNYKKKGDALDPNM